MSKPTSVPLTKADPKPPIGTSKKKSALEFFPAKGLGSYHCFGPTEDRTRKLFRSAVLQYGSLAALPNADQALATVLPKGLLEEASTHGCSLKEVMQEAKAFYASHTPTPKAKGEGVDFDTRRLASILAGLSPDGAPLMLLTELKDLIRDKSDAALKHLERMEREAGRDKDGFIYLRRVAK